MKYILSLLILFTGVCYAGEEDGAYIKGLNPEIVAVEKSPYEEKKVSEPSQKIEVVIEEVKEVNRKLDMIMERMGILKQENL